MCPVLRKALQSTSLIILNGRALRQTRLLAKLPSSLRGCKLATLHSCEAMLETMATKAERMKRASAVQIHRMARKQHLTRGLVSELSVLGPSCGRPCEMLQGTSGGNQRLASLALCPFEAMSLCSSSAGVATQACWRCSSPSQLYSLAVGGTCVSGSSVSIASFRF